MRVSFFRYWLLAFIGAAFSNAAQKPNIIFILADDMGHSDMSWQGSPIQTPNLDKLREGGMYLERNYVQPQCTPSRVAFLTGNYPYRFGLHEHIVLNRSLNGIPGNVKTIAEKMKEGGYRTSIIGKWHVGGHLESHLPHNQGFDYSFICINGTMNYWNYKLLQTYDLIRNGEKVYPDSPINEESSGNTYATDMWAQEAAEVIQRHDEKDPLFMFLSFNAPHHPLDVKEDVLAKYDEANVDSYWSGADAKHKRNARSRKRYMALVDSMDAGIGKVVEALEKKNILKNTLIVFTSDNGGIIEADNRPFRNGKGDSFEGGIRVPAIAHWPSKLMAGSTSQELVYIADWYATFAELSGLDVESNKDGVSAWSVLLGKPGKRKSIPIISSNRHAYVSQNHALVGGGSDYQQLLSDQFSSFALYDLKKDISQATPIQTAPEAKQKAIAGLSRHFKETQRGYYNWDVKYAHTTKRWKERVGDHSYDFVVNDIPELTLTNHQVTISPVSKELTYRLQSIQDGSTWHDVAEYVSKENADSYTFGVPLPSRQINDYRVVTTQHYGLPAHEHFGTPKIGELDAFLPQLDTTGQVSVEKGVLKLDYNHGKEPGSRTRYFVVPHSRGKVFATMKLKFKGQEPECKAHIRWLRQNGWNGATVAPITLEIENSGVFLDHSDTVRSAPKARLSGYDGTLTTILFEFDLGSTANDSLKVYLNPNNDELGDPDSILNGEFTFDRLQLALTGRSGSSMEIYDLKVSTKLKDVL